VSLQDPTMKGLSALVIMLLLSGCAQRVVRQTPPDDYEPIAADPSKVVEIRDDVIRALLDKGQYYAALAHIQEQKQAAPDSAQLIYLEAEARRHLGQTAAAELLYRRLMGGALEGKAWHGIGLMLTRKDLEGAIRALRSASAKLPTDVEIRNDLGYALMEAGRYSEALPELSTAAELAPAQLKSRNNLIILMLLTGNQPGADQMAKQAGATAETMKRLRAEAQSIRSRQAARSSRSPS